MRPAARCWTLLLLLWAAATGGALAQAGDAAAGRMLYRDTPLLRGSLQACAQCHPNPLNQRRGLSLDEQNDHIRCAIQGGCGGATLAVYPYGAMAQFQGLLSGADIQHLARYIREPELLAAWPRLQPRRSELAALAIGQSQGTRLTLDNAGELPLRVQALRVDGLGAADFQIEGHDCSGALAPGARCTVRLQHRPSCGLRREARLLIEHDGPLSPAVSTLSATGLGVAGPELRQQPESLDFHAALGVGTELPLQLSNACDGELAIASLRLDGPFELLADACSGLALAGGQHCELRLRRRLTDGAPEALAEAVGALWVRAADGAERRIALRAAALPPAQAQWRPEPEPAAILSGGETRWTAARLQNSGAQALLLQGLSSSDPAFRIDTEAEDSCRDGLQLPAAGHCALRLRFSPTRAGKQSSRIELRAAPGAVPLSLQVSAMADAPTTPVTPSGGGAAGPWLLLLLLATLALRPSR